MAGNPTLPKHPKNPVGQTALVRKARREWAAHTKPIRKWLLAEWYGVPRQRIEANAGHLTVNRYTYQISLARLNALIAELVSRLKAGPTKTRWQRYARQSYHQGTTQEVLNLQDIAGERYPRTVAEVLRSDPWITRVAMVEARVFEEMAGFEGDAGVDLGRILRTGVEDGLAPDIVADEIRKTFKATQTRANRIARTEITGAYRRARWDEDADANQRLGIHTRLMHLSALSPTSRENHKRRHGLLYTQDQVREWYSEGANGINCFLPGARVKGRFVAGSKTFYRGKAIKFVTASGRQLSVTPNHRILTERGLVAAGEVHEGDNLVTDGAYQRGRSRAGHLDDQNASQRVEDVYHAAASAGRLSGVRIGPADFYGDGAAVDVNTKALVVTLDREAPLESGAETAVFKFLDYLANQLSMPEPSRTGLFHQGLRRVAGQVPSECRAGPVADEQAPLCVPAADGAAGDAKPFGLAGERIPGQVLPVERLDVPSPGLAESADHGADVQADGLGDTGGVLAGLAALDPVVDIVSFPYVGHVYDLEEMSGLMVADGIVVTNCKCSQVSVLTDENGRPDNAKFVEEVRARYTGG